MRFKENWTETKERFAAWWKRSLTDRPLMRLVARRKTLPDDLEPVDEFETPRERYTDVDGLVKMFRNYCKSHTFMAESFPNLDLNLGAGSLAIYLGSDPIFSWDTVWFKECMDDLESCEDLKFDPENYWWKTHLDMIKRGRALSRNEFLINIPDLVEGLDILSAMRGPQNLCYDLMDVPERVKYFVEQLDDLYFKYYDPMYDALKDDEGASSFTAFHVWGPGRTAKLQCDFSAMISPGQFRDFVVPSLRKQCRMLDFSIFHLDGPECIKHVDALMEIEELHALQWTPGVANPPGQDEVWYPLYDKVHEAGKGLWIFIEGQNIHDLVECSKKLVRRYGISGLYLLYEEMDQEVAEELLRSAGRKFL